MTRKERTRSNCQSLFSRVDLPTSPRRALTTTTTKERETVSAITGIDGKCFDFFFSLRPVYIYYNYRDRLFSFFVSLPFLLLLFLFLFQNSHNTLSLPSPPIQFTFIFVSSLYRERERAKPFPLLVGRKKRARTIQEPVIESILCVRQLRKSLPIVESNRLLPCS